VNWSAENETHKLVANFLLNPTRADGRCRKSCHYLVILLR